VCGAVDIVVHDGDVVDLIELAQFFRVGELLLEAIVVRVVFTGVSFASVNDEKLETEFWVLPIKRRQRSNLPHKRRSRDAAELQQDMLPASEGRQRNQIAVEVRQAELWRPAADFGHRPKVRRRDLALPKGLVIVTAHDLATCAGSGRRHPLVTLVHRQLKTND
jgi:hypothetical protein